MIEKKRLLIKILHYENLYGAYKITPISNELEMNFNCPAYLDVHVNGDFPEDHESVADPRFLEGKIISVEDIQPYIGFGLGVRIEAND